MQTRALQSIDESGLPIYALAGRRAEIAEHGTQGFAIRQSVEGKFVDVGVLRKSGDAPNAVAGARIDIVDTLATRLMLAAQQTVPHGVDRHDWFELVGREAGKAEGWSALELKVAGHLVRFLHLTADGHWVAFADIGDAWLYVHSLGAPAGSLELVLIDDLMVLLG